MILVIFTNSDLFNLVKPETFKTTKHNGCQLQIIAVLCFISTVSGPILKPAWNHISAYNANNICTQLLNNLKRKSNRKQELTELELGGEDGHTKV